MSSIIPENANEGESILPEVEELSEFHPDHLSSLVDIHEELERLAASQNGTEELMEMPSVVDVDDVDHEVTIVAEQENEDTSILPDIKQNSKSIKGTVVTICEGYNEIMIAGNHEQTIPHEETLLNSMDNEFELNNPNQLKNSELVIGKSSVITPKLTMRSLPVTEILKSKKPVIGIVQQKSNVLTKVLLDPKKQSSTDAPIIYGDKIRIVGQNKSTLLTNSSKTITVNQAREMGILSTGKLQQILPNHSKCMFKKSVMINPNKALAMIKSSPTKILPLPAGGQLHSIASSCSSVNTLSVSSTPNKIFIRQPSTSVKHTNFSGTILATTSASSQGPIVQLPVSRDNNQIHQIHLPGKQTSPTSPPKPVVPPPPQPPLPTINKEVITKETVTTPTAQRSKLPSEPPNGIRPRKPCNCTKSQCLKLYCDCFANGEFCFQCNCNCCFNNLDHEEERQRAIRSCLDRNPGAFKPKIGKGYIGDERRHNKGCNCKRSGCLKNYCECYEAKIPCSNNCKCIGCRNIEETKDRSCEGGKINHQIILKNKLSSEIEESAFKPNSFLNNQGARQPFSLMTHEVVEATCQCLLARVEEDHHTTEHVERIILEEFGRCLVEIINCATRTTVNNP